MKTWIFHPAWEFRPSLYFNPSPVYFSIEHPSILCPVRRPTQDLFSLPEHNYQREFLFCLQVVPEALPRPLSSIVLQRLFGNAHYWSIGPIKEQFQNGLTKALQMDNSSAMV
jgi:hypothetical protein